MLHGTNAWESSFNYWFSSLNEINSVLWNDLLIFSAVGSIQVIFAQHVKQTPQPERIILPNSQIVSPTCDKSNCNEVLLCFSIITKRRRDQSFRSCSWNHKSFRKVTSFYRDGKEKVLKCLGSLSTHPWDKRGNWGMALSLSLSCSLHSIHPCIPAATQHLTQLFSDFVTWFCDRSGLVTKWESNSQEG